MVSNSLHPPFRETIALAHNCNVGCHCSLKEYDPVCGIDGTVYYSPCHAGCMTESLLDDKKVGFDKENLEIQKITKKHIDLPGFAGVFRLCLHKAASND